MPTILVAEDDPQVRELVDAVLAAEGFNVHCSPDGADALERLRHEKFDLLLLDIWMPRMNGLYVLSHLHAQPSAPKVLVMTADSTPGTVIEAVREQAYQYILKPFERRTLLDAVRAALGNAATPPIKVISARPDWIELLVPSTVEAADRVQSFLEAIETDLSPEVRESVGKAFRELLMNAVEWGGRLDPRRKVRIACLRTSRLLLYRIADPGPGFSERALTHSAISNPPGQPIEHERLREQKGLRPGGFGILMAQAMVDELVYNETHNEVVLIKYLR